MTCNLHRCTMYVERKAQTTFSGNYRRKKDFSFFYNAEILLMFSFFETEPPIAVTSPAVFFGPPSQVGQLGLLRWCRWCFNIERGCQGKIRSFSPPPLDRCVFSCVVQKHRVDTAWWWYQDGEIRFLSYIFSQSFFCN